MKRLLIVGADVANFHCIQWSEWLSHALDYQALVLDCRKAAELPPHSVLAATLHPYVNNGHTVYAILPEAKALNNAPMSMSFFPGMQVNVIPAKGQTLNLRDADPLFKSYLAVLDGHEVCFQLTQAQQVIFVSGIADNISRSICGKYLTVYLLHPPAPKFEERAFKILIEHFGPDPLSVQKLSRPTWVDQTASALPGVAEIQHEIRSIQAEIEQRLGDLKKAEDKLAERAAWADLLWLDGMPLQMKVSEALNFLGVHAQTSSPTGHTGDLTADEQGIHFVFEVTGSTGSIGIEKGRQLLQWVSEAADPNTAKGVLIANAFRNHAPNGRPPTPDHKIFVTELEKFAERFHLGLLDIRELYRIVCLTLTGQTTDPSTVLNGLAIDGTVRFPIA
jgi:hypothetical protein